MSSGYPEIGELVGPFRVGDRLGVGGMGVVFRARDTQLNRDIALKIIAPHLSGDADFQARFVREARAPGLARLGPRRAGLLLRRGGRAASTSPPS